MDRRKLLRRLLDGRRKNVRFGDFTRLVEGFGFRLSRTSGSHHIYQRSGVTEALNLQSESGQAIPYQVKQFLDIVEKYDLRLEE